MLSKAYLDCTVFVSEHVACCSNAAHQLCGLQKLGSQGNLKCPQSFVDPNTASGNTESSPVVITEDEQADVYCCWAESALLKFR